MKFSIFRYQFSNNFQSSILKSLIIKTLKLECKLQNCKLIIAAPKGDA